MVDTNSNEASILPSHMVTTVSTSPRKSRKPFTIGGKSRLSQEPASSQNDVTDSSKTGRLDANSPTPKSSPPPMPQGIQAEVGFVEEKHEEIHEETPEEKAERKRAELKRRNEEIARKQAQHKKKKRF